MTPNLFHFAVVLVVSATALAPGLAAATDAAVVGTCAVVGFGYAAATAVRMRIGKIEAPPHWSDFWCYAVAPAVIYLFLAAAAAAVWWAPAGAPSGIAVTLTVLLLVAIRNAWDLVTFIAPRARPGQL